MKAAGQKVCKTRPGSSYLPLVVKVSPMCYFSPTVTVSVSVSVNYVASSRFGIIMRNAGGGVGGGGGGGGAGYSRARALPRSAQVLKVILLCTYYEFCGYFS